MGVTLKTLIMCALMSMVPVLELRAALPTAIGMGANPWLALVVCVVANLVPVPFIILFVRKILDYMENHGGFFKKVSDWIMNKANKNVGIYYKYSIIGLAIFVAIPLPGTGAWSAALIAAVLNLRMKAALPAIAIGVVAAGFIVLVTTHSIMGIIGHIT